MSTKNFDLIKNKIIDLSSDIVNLDNEGRLAAIKQLQDTIGMLQLGEVPGIDLQNKKQKIDKVNIEEVTKKQNNEELKQSTNDVQAIIDSLPPGLVVVKKPKKDAPSAADNEWLTNTDTFFDDSTEAVEKGKETVTVEAKFNPNDEIRRQLVTTLYNGFIPTCDVCGSMFPTVGTLNDHMKKHNDKAEMPVLTPEVSAPVPGTEQNSFKCIYGDYHADSVQGLKSHLDYKHCSEQPKFLCQEGDYGTNNQHSLKMHMNKHKSDIVCNICDVSFTRQANLRRHKEGVQHKMKVKNEFNTSVLKTEVKFDDPAQLSQTINQEATVNDTDKILENNKQREVEENYDVKTGASEVESNFEETNEFHENVPEPDNIITSSPHENRERDNETANEHFIQHDGKYECSICNKVYSTKGSFNNHQAIHTDKYKCQNCRYRFENKIRLKTHNCETIAAFRSEVPKNRPYECNQCDKKFTNKSNLGAHKNIHLGTYKCGTCSKCFPNSRELKKHYKRNPSCVGASTEDSYEDSSVNESVETDIDNSSTTETSVETEMTNDTNEADEERNTTSLETNTILNRTEMEQESNHVKICDVEENKQIEENAANNTSSFTCDECDKTFKHKRNLLAHKVGHTDKYKCQNCGKRFEKQRVLVNHSKSCQQTSSEEMLEDDTEMSDDDYEELSCKKCAKYFATLDSLSIHEKICEV